MSEHDQQVAVVEWCAAQGIPVFAIPNGGLRSKRTAAMLKAEGVKPGVPDLFIPLPRGDYAGLFVEMKDVKGRPPRQSQMQWLDLLNANGYAAYWAKGAEAAIELIGRYAADGNTCQRDMNAKASNKGHNPAAMGETSLAPTKNATNPFAPATHCNLFDAMSGHLCTETRMRRFSLIGVSPGKRRLIAWLPRLAAVDVG